MKPYPEQKPGPQAQFNMAHSRTRVKVEMTIGILKARFQFKVSGWPRGTPSEPSRPNRWQGSTRHDLPKSL